MHTTKNAAKNAASKNHCRKIKRDENHLPTPFNIKYSTKSRNTYRHLDIEILKIAKTHILVCLPHLPDHSHKARDQTKQCTATILRHNNFHGWDVLLRFR